MHIVSKMFTLALAVVALVTITGCWGQFRQGQDHTGWNGVSGPSTTGVRTLVKQWATPTGFPIDFSSPAYYIYGFAPGSITPQQ